MTYTHPFRRHASYALPMTVALGAILWGSTAHAAFNMQTSFTTLAQGVDPAICAPEAVYGQVTYSLTSVQGKPYTFGSSIVVAPGGVLAVAGTATHNGCGTGSASVSTNGSTDYRPLDHHETLTFTTALIAPVVPGTYTFTVVIMTTADGDNYATASITLPYRVQYPGRLLLCPDGVQSLEVGATRQFESRYWSAREDAPDCTSAGYPSVTDASAWSSADTGILTVTNYAPRGIAYAVATGNTEINVAYAGLVATRPVTVTGVVTPPPVPTPGMCATARNTCASGTANDDAYADTETEYRWRCDSSEGGANSGMCTAPAFPAQVSRLQVCVGLVLLAIDGGTVPRTLSAGTYEDVSVYYDASTDCLGTDIANDTVFRTDAPDDVVSIAPGSPARVTASTIHTGEEDVIVVHAAGTVTPAYTVPGSTPPPPTAIDRIPQ